jgi:tripartite-type tricarboxylate transporter receptor subunit TctC
MSPGRHNRAIFRGNKIETEETVARRPVAIVSGLALLAVGTAASAQDPEQRAYPTKPVRVLVPFPPGGAVDIVARTIGDDLTRRWGQSVVIENRPGAGGTIATQALATSAADGYTLALVATGHALNPHFYVKLPYDSFNDFTPITLVGSSPNMLLVRGDSPFKSVTDVLTGARRRPGYLSYGHAGNGTSPHLAGELLKYLARVDIAAIPYKGGAPSLNDLIGGHVPMTFNNIPESIAQVKAGAVRALGVTTATRAPVLPDVPTIAEAGVPGYDTGVWWGFLAPAGIPPEVKAKLARDCAEAVKAPAVVERLRTLGATAVSSTPEEFADFMRAEYEKWGPVIKAAGIKAE